MVGGGRGKIRTSVRTDSYYRVNNLPRTLNNWSSFEKREENGVVVVQVPGRGSVWYLYPTGAALYRGQALYLTISKSTPTILIITSLILIRPLPNYHYALRIDNINTPKKNLHCSSILRNHDREVTPWNQQQNWSNNIKLFLYYKT